MPRPTPRVHELKPVPHAKLVRVIINYDGYLKALTTELKRMVEVVERSPLEGAAAEAWKEFHRNATDLTERLNNNLRKIREEPDDEPADATPPTVN